MLTVWEQSDEGSSCLRGVSEGSVEGRGVSEGSVEGRGVSEGSVEGRGGVWANCKMTVLLSPHVKNLHNPW